MSARQSSSSRPNPRRIPLRPARVCVESAHTLAYPIAPLGDGVLSRAGSSGAGAGVSITFPEIDWALLHQPSAATQRVPSAHVLDVYVALLSYWARADKPDDGIVRFEQSVLFRDVGWVKGSKRSASGRHCQQLEDALWHLQHTTLRWTGGNAPDPDFGEPGRGLLSVSVVSAYRIGRAHTRRSSPNDVAAAAEPTAGCWVELGRSFVRLLKAQWGVVKFDAGAMLCLPSGTPRVLCRALTWYRHRGINTIPLRQLYPRIGSVEQRLTPSRAEQILGRAHAAMVEQGILASHPEYVWTRPPDASGRMGEEMCVSYSFGVRSGAFLDPEDELLARTARLYGVSEAMTLELLHYREQLRDVLHAVGEGIVAPRYPAGYIIDATRYGWDVSAKSPPDTIHQGKRALPPPARSVVERYTDWRLTQVQRYLARGGVDHEAVHDEARGRLRARHGGVDVVVSEEHLRAEVDAVLDIRLGLPTLAEYSADPDGHEERVARRAPSILRR